MAVTKIHPIKTTLNKAIGYITNPEKTNNGMLVSSYNCQSQFAEIEMQGLLVSIEHEDLNGLVFVPNNYDIMLL